MSADLYTSLRWLPPVDDFAAACRNLEATEGELGDALRALATHALTDARLTRLAAFIADARRQGRSLRPLIPFKLGLMGTGTLGLLVPTLIATAARHGFLLDVVVSDYGQAVRDALSPDSRINAARCDAVLLVCDDRELPLRAALGEPEDAGRAVAESVDLVARVCEGLRQHGGAHVFAQTIAPPAEALFGALDASVPGTPRHLVEAFNGALRTALPSATATILDAAALAETVGLAEWHAPTQWNMAKLPFSMTCAPLYADHVCRLIAARAGRARRALILDLDNTLWGGVIGDDGMEGIVLGEGNATGEAFLSVQRMALRLRERGIVLAVSSKNTDSVARRVFREHPDMLLREEHIAVFQANWNDKATNITAIAKELSLGLDAMVFLDDNPVERALVRRLLPQVAVPELPDDPALYARTLMAAGYFESATFSAEDRARAGFYQNNARRAALAQGVGGLDDYIAALEMDVTFAPFDAVGRARVHQLINKSNQFNLTTRRYAEAEIRELEDNPAVFTTQVRVRDRFGDNGMVSVVICRPGANGDWIIDTWLMSCRVLGRGVERLVLGHMLDRAAERGIRRLVGAYVPSGRNDLVRDHYEKLGFSATSVAADGRSTWELAVPGMGVAVVTELAAD